MKKLLSVVLLATILMLLVIPVLGSPKSTEDLITYYEGEKQVLYDSAILSNNTVLQPLKLICDRMGIHMKRSLQTKTVLLEGGKLKVEFKTNDNKVTVEEQLILSGKKTSRKRVVLLNSKVSLARGRVHVPLDFLSKCLGLDVDYNLKEKTVQLKYPLFPIRYMTRWGFINKNGCVLIDPVYADVQDFSEGLAGVFRNGKWGFIDKRNVNVVRCEYHQVRRFSEGLAAVAVEVTQNAAGSGSDHHTAYLFGFIDKNGKQVIAPQFPIVKDFCEGLAPVGKLENHVPCWGYIDCTGKLVIDMQFDEITPFNQGIALVSTKKNNKIVIIDPYGQLVSEVKYATSIADAFAEGLAPVHFKKLVSSSKYITYVDMDGKPVMAHFQFSSACSFREGLALVSIKTDGYEKFGYIDQSGKYIIPPQFLKAYNFSEGLAAVKVGKLISSKYGFIDKTGKFILEPFYEDAINFKDGLALVKTKDNYGYINKSGESIFSAVLGDYDFSIFKYKVLPEFYRSEASLTDIQ